MRRRVAAVARQLASRACYGVNAQPAALTSLAAPHARFGVAASAPRWPPLLPPAAQALGAACAQRRFAHGRGSGEEASAASSGSAPPTPPPAAGRDAVGESPADDEPPPRSWLDDALPARAVPFAKLARLDAPAGTLLLLAPCAWSIALAAPAGALPDPRLLGLFTLGAVLLRGAGCTVNDLWDRDIDARVARTRHRPLACGAVTPAGALVFLGAQLGVGLGVLLQLNPFAQVLGASSLGLVAAYPLMKRITNWPQAFLGLTFNWGALLVRSEHRCLALAAPPGCHLRCHSRARASARHQGWAAVRGELDLAVVGPLYAAGVCWTLVYDTIYAHQDAADDARVGVRSTALHFGAQTPRWLSGFGAGMVTCLAASGYAADAGPLFYAGISIAGTHLAHQARDERASTAARTRL